MSSQTQISPKTTIKRAMIVSLMVGIFYFYEYFLRVMPSVLTNDLMAHFNINYTGIGILSSSFYLTYMFAQLPVGITMDRFGARISLAIACLVCAIGTYMFALTNDITISLIGRSLIGLGSAFAFVGFLKIAAAWLPISIYSFMVGLCMLLGTTGAVAGEKLLVILLEYASWQQISVITAHIGIVLSLLIWLVVRNAPAATYETSHSNNISTVLNALSIGLRSKKIWLLGIIGMCTYVALSAYAEMWAVPFFQQIGYTKHEAASISSLVFWGFGFGGPIWGLIAIYCKSRATPLWIGSALSLLIFAFIVAFPTMPAIWFYILNFLFGAVASVEILVFTEANAVSNQETNATIVALVNMIVMLGGIVLQPLVGYILDLSETIQLCNYQIAMTILASFYFIAIFASILSGRSKTI